MANKIKYLQNIVTSIIRINTRTMSAIQLYFTEFKIVHLSIKEIRNA